MIPMRRPSLSLLFFFNDTATTEIYTLSLHDALPISRDHLGAAGLGAGAGGGDCLRCSHGRQKVPRSVEHTSELQSPDHLVCRLLLEKKMISANSKRSPFSSRISSLIS